MEEVHIAIYILCDEISSRRQIVETAFSCITSFLPRYIKVRTEQGFKIRVMAAVLAYSMAFLIN